MVGNFYMNVLDFGNVTKLTKLRRLFLFESTPTIALGELSKKKMLHRCTSSFYSITISGFGMMLSPYKLCNMLEYQTNESFEFVPAMTCPMYGESLVLQQQQQRLTTENPTSPKLTS